jgi:hypothetical protein
MKIYQKLQEARKLVTKNGYKKEGRNDYSKYDYFTPEQVEQIVAEITEETQTMCICNLKRNEFGLYQELKLVDLESEEELIFELATEKGEIKATNSAQQMGGTDTYSERYIKMKVFQIKDNNLDPDSKDNRVVDYGEKKVGVKEYRAKNKADFEAGKDPLDDEI